MVFVFIVYFFLNIFIDYECDLYVFLKFLNSLKCNVIFGFYVR